MLDHFLQRAADIHTVVPFKDICYLTCLNGMGTFRYPFYASFFSFWP